MTRTEQTMIGVVGGGVLAPVAGGVANAVKYMRGKPLIPLREKIIPEKTVEPDIIPVKEAELRQRYVDEAASEMTLDEFAIRETGKPLTVIDDVAEAGVKRPSILDNSVDTALNVKIKPQADGSNIVKKYELHPSILKIKENVKVKNKFQFQDTTEDELYLKINSLDAKKSCKDDEIPPKILIGTNDIVSSYLSKIYNDSKNSERFPTSLTKS